MSPPVPGNRGGRANPEHDPRPPWSAKGTPPPLTKKPGYKGAWWIAGLRLSLLSFLEQLQLTGLQADEA